jgi:late competence protein required for DNA uptake (superfamily II DNA/RNA helicase)
MNKCIMDVKSGDKTIYVDGVSKCAHCHEPLPDNSNAYFGEDDKAIYCRKCIVVKGFGSRSQVYHWGVVKNDKL